ncbi:MAG: hypothetical protein GYA55_01370 [SAR324 cluster bacterium]|uniref:YjeF N-terminal domain-containing protein n=1 Tax=SAR324 cluster bacterium TaxID=2024889 RepID=A0A7X9FQ19_9DELT|nr:hypothetical protein [SAR324 cluster bacterium]
MQSGDTRDSFLFYDKTGIHFHGVSKQQLLDARKILITEIGLSNLQITEAASYSLAMVVRFALGLSATGGKVCLVVNDSLAGQVALACARHLRNAGSETILLPFCAVSNASDDFRQQFQVLQKMDVKVVAPETISTIETYFEQAHNLIFALYGGNISVPFAMDDFIKFLNESRIPIHCIESPFGVNVDTGFIEDEALYASSTLSLGAPFKGLHPANDYVGRHYLCDISLTKSLYETMGDDLSRLFSDQPVIQIFPEKNEGSQSESDIP